MDQQSGAVVVVQEPAVPAKPIPVQVETGERLIELWLHGRPRKTAQAYRSDVAGFMAFAPHGLRAVRVADLQAYQDSLARFAPAGQARRMSSIKSLLTYAHRLGFVAFNTGAAIKLPSVKNTLAERILDQADMHRMLALEPDARNSAMLRLIYGGGLRISEVAGLCWRDLQARGDAGQATVFGKGGKTRVILLPASVWRQLAQLRGDAEQSAPVFLSGRGPAPARAAILIRLPCIAWSRQRRPALDYRLRCQRIGCATPMRRMRSTAARRSTWCSRRWATPA